MARWSGESTRRAAGAAAVALLLAPLAARAAPPCNFVSATAIAFGIYDPFSPSHLDATGTVRYRCPASAAPQISLSRGASATFLPREMRGAGDVLRYNLYVNSGFTDVWGDGSEGTRVYLAPRGNGQVTVYGRIFAGQDPTVGSYADTVTVTVNL